MAPFTGTLKSVQIKPGSSTIVFDIQKQAPFDHRSILVVETNADKETLALVTNLVVGENYVFPDSLKKAVPH